ncbi:MAG TPA: efflux RND transporter periplasmic adaptor subunit [Saprospiraceae bacterium]|nr:efflux RND transporter periplasmic adaptor subunit [Saprospiraceae bacterium]
MKPLLTIFFAVLVLILFKVLYLDKKESKDDKQVVLREVPANTGPANAILVDIHVARKAETANIIYASGTMVANEEVEIRSEINGRVIELRIDEGSKVAKDQLIARLDDRDLQAQLKRLEFEEELANQTEARQRRLLEIDAISKEEYDLAMNTVKTLSADKELLLVNLDKTRISAPFHGRIGLKNISLGAYITPQELIANLVQTDPIRIDFTIPERYSSKVKINQTFTFNVDGRDENFEARVVAIDPKIDEELRTLRIRAITSNKNDLFLPGMFVRLTFPLDAEKSIMVPTESIIPILKGKKVFVMNQGRAEERIVTTGLRTDRNIQILDGVSEGDSIITSALINIIQGSPVAIKQIINP